MRIFETFPDLTRGEGDFGVKDLKYRSVIVDFKVISFIGLRGGE
jgi:hypothetical protein